MLGTTMQSGATVCLTVQTCTEGIVAIDVLTIPLLTYRIALLHVHLHVKLDTQALLAFMTVHKAHGMQLHTSFLILPKDKT